MARSTASSAGRPAAGPAPADADLRSALERALSQVGVGRPRRIRRRPFEYATSFPLEELEVTLEDGAELRLLYKRLAWSGLEESGRLAKPEFLHDPRREPAVYASLLSPRGLGPRYYGSVADPSGEGCWLFIERVKGRELYQVGELELWRAVASWLGRVHADLAGDAERLVADGRLIVYDEVYYRRWIDRAREFASAPGQARSRLLALDWIGERYDTVVEALLGLPRTVLHGELYASNVLIADASPRPRICPVDWEMAAFGPGLIDLAALISGGWGEHERQAIASAYCLDAEDVAQLRRQLDYCRLHLAVQWLGWAPHSWTPPNGQRHDWLSEALVLAEGLDL